MKQYSQFSEQMVNWDDMDLLDQEQKDMWDDEQKWEQCDQGLSTREKTILVSSDNAPPFFHGAF